MNWIVLAMAVRTSVFVAVRTSVFVDGIGECQDHTCTMDYIKAELFTAALCQNMSEQISIFAHAVLITTPPVPLKAALALLAQRTGCPTRITSYTS